MKPTMHATNSNEDEKEESKEYDYKDKELAEEQEEQTGEIIATTINQVF
jgi:hypothetical protein